jgi:signal transduction histidine kinase
MLFFGETPFSIVFENMEPFSRTTFSELAKRKDTKLERSSQFGTPEPVPRESLAALPVVVVQKSENTMQAHPQSSLAARTSFSAPDLPRDQVAVDAEIFRSEELTHSLAHGAGLAHDAGNLFGALGLYCDLLAAPDVLRPEHQHYITELRQLASRSSSLIQALLTSAANAAVPVRSLPEIAPIAAVEAPPDAAVTLRAIEPLLSAIAGTSVVVTCKSPRAIPTPLFQPEVLERILVNLVRNAAQAIETAAVRRAGNIRITLATISGQLRLTVEDNGPGMPVTTAAAFLSPSPLPKGAQRGLGHRIVHELVTASGGQLSLRVRPGRGTTITVHWPVPANERPAQPAPVVTRSSRRLGAATC